MLGGGASGGGDGGGGGGGGVAKGGGDGGGGGELNRLGSSGNLISGTSGIPPKPGICGSLSGGTAGAAIVVTALSSPQ